MSGDEVPTEIFEPDVAIPEFRGMALALESLDGEDLQVWFSTRACTMKSVPRIVRGPSSAGMPPPMKFSRSRVEVGLLASSDASQSSSTWWVCQPGTVVGTFHQVRQERVDESVDPCTGVCRSGSQLPEEDGGGNGQTIQSADLPGPRHS